MTLTFKLETVTPVFPAGADQNAQADDFEGVRPQSIEYGLRWWFRAFAGAKWGSQNLREIRNAESLIFGSAKPVTLYNSQGESHVIPNSLASRLRLAVDSSAASKPFLERDLWLRYLAYGLWDPKGQKQRCYLPPGQKFSFSVRISPPRFQLAAEPGKSGPFAEPEIPETLIRALAECWITCGGIGARWRHGLGGVVLEKDRLESPERTAQRVRTRWKAAETAMAAFLGSLNSAPKQVGESGSPCFPIATQTHARLAWRAEPYLSWEAALKEVHARWRGSRRRDPNDPLSSSRNRDLYAAACSSNPQTVTGQVAEFAGLGLPLPFAFPKGGKGGLVPVGSIGEIVPGGIGQKGVDRAPSPVWFRALPVFANGKRAFGLLAIVWKGGYLPPQTLIKIRKTEKSQTPQWQELRYNEEESGKWFDKQLIRSAKPFQLL